jgi:hypothetical protein
MTEQTIPEEFKREWVKGKMYITFTYDYLRDSIPTNQIEFQIVNVSGENMNRVFRKAGSVTGAEATAIRSAMKREMDDQVLDVANGYTPYPEMRPVVPTEGQTLSGTVTIQIEVLSKTLGEMTVEWRLNGGAWQPTTYNGTSEKYEDSVDTTSVADGGHLIDIRASNGSGVTLQQDDISVLVDNS